MITSATLSFDEEYDLRCALDGTRWNYVVRELMSHLRSVYKHGDNEVEAAFADRLRDLVVDLMADQNLSL